MTGPESPAGGHLRRTLEPDEVTDDDVVLPGDCRDPVELPPRLVQVGHEPVSSHDRWTRGELNP